MSYTIVLPADRQLSRLPNIQDEYVIRRVVRELRAQGILAFYKEDYENITQKGEAFSP